MYTIINTVHRTKFWRFESPANDALRSLFVYVQQFLFGLLGLKENAEALKMKTDGGGPIRDPEPWRSLQYGRESVFRAHVALMRCGQAPEGPRPIARLAGQMACRRKRYEDGRPTDRPAAYHVTETETRGQDVEWQTKVRYLGV
ncbi:hypothetical protein EVAR_40666_1 [Eumeta japonica]|uniref:Uncharacterized protein n=1 Tax=Eumeta variegata TaxID=151549 RepID=A0A4C1X545_EUMVA|nr:hypothetical protein EVAR_40666_1 [Eumeta japonica]